MLVSESVVVFIPSMNPANVRQFYEGLLGLRWVSSDAFAMVLEANGITIRVANVSSIADFKPAPFTILGWRVENIDERVAILTQKGIKFEHYSGMDQNAAGIWTSPAGARVAWFKDPDGNVLSLTEH